MTTSAALNTLTPPAEQSRLESAYAWSINQAIEADEVGRACELAASYEQELNDHRDPLGH